MNKLLINIGDIAKLSSFDGNIDNDSIQPFIFMAQNSEIKRILGLPLYNKIMADFSSGTLVGDYKDIYDNYICVILAYFTCSFYLQMGIPKVSQNGAYLVTPDKTESIWNEKTDKVAQKYEKLATGLEIEFIARLDELNLPERPAPGTIEAKSNFPWMRPI